MTSHFCSFSSPWTLQLTRLLSSYNRYLAVAARAVRRSLKEGPRVAAERRGQMDLRFAKWQVSGYSTLCQSFKEDNS
jgi:hypothetical protein